MIYSAFIYAFGKRIKRYQSEKTEENLNNNYHDNTKRVKKKLSL